jgi:hypothetical protein
VQLMNLNDVTSACRRSRLRRASSIRFGERVAWYAPAARHAKTAIVPGDIGNVI